MRRIKRTAWHWALAGIIGVCGAWNAPAAQTVKVEELRLQPAELTLQHAEDDRRILVSGKTKDGRWIDLTADAVYETPSGVLVDEEGYFRPAAADVLPQKLPQEAAVLVSAGGKTAQLTVKIAGAETKPVSFVRDVMPVVNRVGCSAGTCHGAAKGKNGFRLSLRGYDHEYDYESLVQDISGRRFSRAFPEQSLLLLKPTAEVPHKGGQVLKPDSRHYRLLLRWIAEGVQSDVGKMKPVERLEVFPTSMELSDAGDVQQMLVIAHYEDGSTRDVTREAVFSSSSTEVAEVSESGVVTALRRGESAVLTRYEGAYGTNELIVMGDREGFEWKETPEFNYVDAHVHNKLKRMKIQPSELCSDEVFIRRVSIDLTGLPPQPDDVRSFLKDETPTQEKRAALIERLLASPEYVQRWTHKWADLLQCNSKFLGQKGVWLFRSWIEQSIAENKPYDQFVRELLTAEGSVYQNPAASYYRISRDSSTAVENTTQLFLGVRFSCNKCHDHPFERWTQNQYYELAAYFSDVARKNGRLPGDEIVYTSLNPAPVTHPKTMAPIDPSVPFGEETGESRNLREALANWMTSADNPLFARSAVNRVWSYFMGRGIIEPVDDVRASNPPSNPELLDALVDEFVSKGFDMRQVMRTIVNSRAYQQSVKTNRWNEDDARNFSRAMPKRLTAEQLLDAISEAAGSRPKFPGLPSDFRAVQLPDSRIESDGFLKLFGRPERETVCECERADEVSLAHAMNLINGATIGNALIDPNGRIASLMKSGAEDQAVVEELYLAALCRYPREEEIATALAHMADSESKTEGAQDLLWALLNSPAFIFNR